eukprot:g2856.t1
MRTNYKKRKGKRSGRKKKDPSLSGMDEQLAAMQDAKRALEEAKEQMLAAQQAQASLRSKVERMRKEARQAESQKRHAERNLERVNADIVCEISGSGAPSTKGATDTAGGSSSATKPKQTESMACEGTSPGVVDPVPSYSKKEYWESRYRKEASGEDTANLHVSEWYVDSLTQLLPFVDTVDKSRASVLDVGCGTSTFGEQLCAAGFASVTCIDYSASVISQCRGRKANSAPNVPKYLTMDARSLEFEDEVFDIVFDKGTMDAMLSAGSDRGPGAAEEAMSGAGKMISEIHRVLTPQNGIYILVSSIPPQVYLPALQNLTPRALWDTTVRQINNEKAGLSLSVYILKKAQSFLPAPASILGGAASIEGSDSPCLNGLPLPRGMIEGVIDFLRQREPKVSNDHVTKKMSDEEVRLNALAEKERDCAYGDLIARDAVPRTLTRIYADDTKRQGKLYVRWNIDDVDVGANTGVVGAGNERDYIVLTRSTTPIADVHSYVEMDWVDGKLSGVLEFSVPKTSKINGKASHHNPDGMYEFRYIAETVAWGLQRDVAIARSAPFNPFTLDSASAVSLPAPAIRSAQMFPYAPPVKLQYLLEKRTNISCFQLFVHRPVACVGTVPKGTPLPPIPSPVHVRLHLDASHNPELVCERKKLKLAFSAQGSHHSLEISFADCEIDPRKCTVRAEENHWSMRLPFYFGGSETNHRDSGIWKRPQAIELNTNCILSMACAFCEGPIIGGEKTLTRVSEAPSAFWSELSDFWFCLRGDAENRLQELKGGIGATDDNVASGGVVDVPIRENSAVVGKADVILRWEDRSLGLEENLTVVDIAGAHSKVPTTNSSSAAEMQGNSASRLNNRFGCVEGDMCGEFLTGVGAKMLELPVVEGVSTGDGDGIKLTVLSAEEELKWGVIRVLWEQVEVKTCVNNETGEIGANVSNLERILVGGEAINRVLDCLEWSNMLLPRECRKIGGKKVGFVCW